MLLRVSICKGKGRIVVNLSVKDRIAGVHGPVNAVVEALGVVSPLLQIARGDFGRDEPLPFGHAWDERKALNPPPKKTKNKTRGKGRRGGQYNCNFGLSRTDESG